MIGSESRWTPPSAWCPNPSWWHADTDDPEGAEYEVTNLVRALVRVLQPDIVVETGTASGQTARVIAEALTRNHHGHLYTVEISPVLAQRATKRLKDLPVTVACADSLSWSPPYPIGFAWIDSGAADVRVQEIRNWWPLFGPGAVIGVHDTAPNMGREALAGALEKLTADLGVQALRLRTPRGVTLLQVP